MMQSGQIQIVWMVIFIVNFFVGFFIGEVIRGRNRPTPTGTFVVNHTDPTKDLCTLQLDVDLDVIEASKQISFKVVIIDDSEEKIHETEN